MVGPGGHERILSETSDAADFELRAMALEALGRRAEALVVLEGPAGVVPPVFETMQRGLRGLLGGRNEEAVRELAALVEHHTDPEALFMYGACQARAGDAEGALRSEAAAVERGFTVPQALREHSWLAPLRGSAAFGLLVERAEAARGEADRAFRDAGGPALLGA